MSTSRELPVAAQHGSSGCSCTPHTSDAPGRCCRWRGAWCQRTRRPPRGAGRRSRAALPVCEPSGAAAHHPARGRAERRGGGRVLSPGLRASAHTAVTCWADLKVRERLDEVLGKEVRPHGDPLRKLHECAPYGRSGGGSGGGAGGGRQRADMSRPGRLWSCGEVPLDAHPERRFPAARPDASKPRPMDSMR